MVFFYFLPQLQMLLSRVDNARSRHFSASRSASPPVCASFVVIFSALFEAGRQTSLVAGHPYFFCVFFPPLPKPLPHQPPAPSVPTTVAFVPLLEWLESSWDSMLRIVRRFLKTQTCYAPRNERGRSRINLTFLLGVSNVRTLANKDC